MASELTAVLKPRKLMVQREMSLGACGPRNLMKMASRESKMVTARGSEVESLNGEVEAVEMSDPERA